MIRFIDLTYAYGNPVDDRTARAPACDGPSSSPRAEAPKSPGLCVDCKRTLLPENAWMTNGCPCNVPAGPNASQAAVEGWIAEMVDTWTDDVKGAALLRSDIATLLKIASAADSVSKAP